MSGNVKNMTSGSPGKLILFFALPLMAGNVFQQFYTMVDAMVVGQIEDGYLGTAIAGSARRNTPNIERAAVTKFI